MIVVANFHFEVSIINRSEKSLTGTVNYISGERLYDNYNGKTYEKSRLDVDYCNIFLPRCAPREFKEIQTLCTQIDEAEKRKDARTARAFIGSLPNELSTGDLIQIVSGFIHDNFTEKNLCAIAAIHKGLNQEDPSKNNPHVHIIVPTRTVDNTSWKTSLDMK